MMQPNPAAEDDALWRFLVDLKVNRFFGTAELQFQAGRLMRVKKQEVLEPKDLIRQMAE